MPDQPRDWVLGAVALLLVGYALLAGPVEFWRAASAARPLRALGRLPLYALAVSLVIAILAIWMHGPRPLSWAGAQQRTTAVAAGATADGTAWPGPQHPLVAQNQADLAQKYHRRMPGTVRNLGPR